MTNLHITRILVTLGYIALCSMAPAVVPPPDSGYPGANTGEGHAALLDLTTGTYNTAVGWLSLRSITTANYNTGIGAGALALNTADENTATGAGALLFNSTGIGNTATGAFALFSNTIGNSNTAHGLFALQSNSSGAFNTATGSFALTSNTVASDNTANGAGALESNTGSENTAIGSGALLFNTTGMGSTATGFQALMINTVANGNTAYGYQALSNNAGSAIAASFNTAIGYRALANQTSGVNNIALGGAAGDQITTSDDNIDIGNNGQFSDSATIRIGQVQTATYIIGISNVNEGGSGILPVYINNLGRLGTQPPPSSRRYKHNIRPMDNDSEAILALKPVAFHYKEDGTNTPQFGLIAEEVAEVDSDLVLRDENGEIYTVRYDAVNAMLLNEFLKEHRKVEKQERELQKEKATIAQQEKDFRSAIRKVEAVVAQQQKLMQTMTARLNEQAAQIQKVSAHVDMTEPSADVIVNNP